MTTELILRISIAAILGGIIGLERNYRAKEAGFRTHFLVALGSALFMVISQYGFTFEMTDGAKVSFDPSRIASQVVTGIGFESNQNMTQYKIFNSQGIFPVEDKVAVRDSSVTEGEDQIK